MTTKGLKNYFVKGFTFMMMFFFFAAAANAQNYWCSNNLPDLTDQQKTKLQQLSEAHQKEMNNLRQQKQSATWDKKADISKQMIDKRTAHINEVRNVLNDNQKKAFDQHLNNNNKGTGCGYGNGRGNNNHNGCGYRQGKGHGKGHGHGRGNRNCGW